MRSILDGLGVDAGFEGVGVLVAMIAMGVDSLRRIKRGGQYLWASAYSQISDTPQRPLSARYCCKTILKGRIRDFVEAKNYAVPKKSMA